jgi:hypothetical protein
MQEEGFMFNKPRQYQKLTKRDVIVLVSAFLYLALNIGAGLILAYIYAG